MDYLSGYCEEWSTNLITSKHHYLRRLANNENRILYLEVPRSIGHILFSKEIFKNIKDLFFARNLKEVEKNIWVLKGYVIFPYTNTFLGIFSNRIFNKFNQFVYKFYVKRAMNKLSFKDTTFISYLPFLHPEIEFFNFKKIIFHVVDNWLGLKKIPESSIAYIDAMADSADVVITSGELLFKDFKIKNNNTFLLDHGTDYDLFSPVVQKNLKPHNILSDIKKPIIGYYGALHKLDFKLVNDVASKNQDKNFIFVGPLSGNQGLKIKSKFENNIYFFPSIERDELPNLLSGIDVFWMPFYVDKLTQYMSPIKIFEVLSAGIPTVSAKLYECERIGKKHICFANSSQEYCYFIDILVKENSLDSRIYRSNDMKKYDWNNRFIKFEKYIGEN